jgi:hypothetical protein
MFFLNSINFVRKSKVINLLAFLIPFELLVAYFASGAIRPILGNGYRIFLYGNIVIFYIFILAKFRNKVFNQKLIFLLICYNLLGLFEVLVTILNNSFITESLTQYTLGFLSPSLFVLHVSTKSVSKREGIYYSLYFGTIVILIVTFLLVFYNYNTYPIWFRERDFISKLFIFRYLINGEDGIVNPAMILLGNFNKESNYLIYLNLFSLTLLDRNKRFYFICFFWFISTAALLMLFSRMTLFMLPLVYYISGFHEYLRSKLKFAIELRYVFYFVIITSLIFNFSFLKPAFDYLFLSKISDDAEADVVGSGNARLVQWSGIYDKYFNSEGIMGLGHGEYSFREYGYFHGGSHNLFIDHFLASGIIFPIFLFIMLILLWLLSFLNGSKLLALSFLLFFMLAFREYSFSYLNATMQGGLYFCLILYLYSIKTKSVILNKN